MLSEKPGLSCDMGGKTTRAKAEVCGSVGDRLKTLALVLLGAVVYAAGVKTIGHGWTYIAALVVCAGSFIYNFSRHGVAQGYDPDRAERYYKKARVAAAGFLLFAIGGSAISTWDQQSARKAEISAMREVFGRVEGGENNMRVKRSPLRLGNFDLWPEERPFTIQPIVDCNDSRTQCDITPHGEGLSRDLRMTAYRLWYGKAMSNGPLEIPRRGP